MRNISAAIDLYKRDYGYFPLTDTPQVIYSSSELIPHLSTYLSSMPIGPTKNSKVLLYHYMDFLYATQPNLKTKEGEYWYWKMYKPWAKKQVAAVLVAKVELPNYANYVFKYQTDRNVRPGWSLWIWLDYWYDRWMTIESIYLCSRVDTGKVKKWEERIADWTNTECTYSSNDQLYYVMKFE